MSQLLEGIVALVRFSARDARVLGSRPAEFRHSLETPEPRIVPGNWHEFPPGDGQVIVALYGEADDPEPLVIGAVDRTTGYVDAPSRHERSRLVGGIARPRHDDRMLELDVSDKQYMAFFRMRLEEPDGKPEADPDQPRIRDDGGTIQMSLHLLRVYGLPDDNGSFPPKPDFLLAPFFPVVDDHRPILWRRLIKKSVPEWKYEGLTKRTWTWPSGENSCGSIRSREDIKCSLPRKNAYNIVIMADGFDESEYTEQDRWVQHLIQALASTASFRSHWDQVNIHQIRTVSRSSGIPGCPCECDRGCSYLGIQGNWREEPGDITYPAFIGAYDYQWIYGIAEPFAPFELVNLYLVVVNCEVPGGSAYVNEKIAFVTVGNESWRSTAEVLENFTRIGVHEAMHVVGNLADEYIAADDGPYKNTRNCQPVFRDPGSDAWHGVASNSVWKVQAEAHGDYNPGTRHFSVINLWVDTQETYDNGDPILLRADSSVIPYGTAEYEEEVRRFGMYWGCQYIEAADETDIGDDYNDPRGRRFYRGEARCLMRRLDQPICKVCEKILDLSIENRGPVWRPPV